MASDQQALEQLQQANVLMKTVLDITRQQLQKSMAVSAELEALLVIERHKTAEYETAQVEPIDGDREQPL